MKKKGFLFLLLMLLSFGVIACEKTTTVPTTVTTAFSVTLAGLTDVGFTADDKILTGESFDLLAGVTAIGTDGVDYADRIQLSSDDAACQIEDDNTLHSNTAKTCTITYLSVVNSKVTRANRLVKISAAPVTVEFTETDRIDNTALFGTDYTVTTTDPGVNMWHYWQESNAVLGTTGSVTVSGGKLIIVQETTGSVGYALQVPALTEASLEQGRTYKITMTITSDAVRVIDIVTKAPNDDYGNDTHSLIEIAEGTAEYEMVFVANQDVLHLNIMTGLVEGNVNVGTLEFSNLTLFEGPELVNYTELTDFFVNTEVASGTSIEYITGTDTDYVREFYYWDENSGALLTGTTTADGIDLTVPTAATNDYGIQLQWNDVNKAGQALTVNQSYLLEMNITSSVARTIKIEVTGKTNSLAASVSQSFELQVGDNPIALEFTSLYDYFFLKMHFGNYGDLVQTGTFSITGLKLSEGTGEVVPVDDEVSYVQSYLQIVNGNFNAVGFAINGAGSAWTTWTTINETWTTPVDANFSVVDGAVVVETLGTGDYVWSIQLQYRPGLGLNNVVAGNKYKVEFDVNASVAGTFSMELTTTGNAGNVAIDVTLVEGDNHVVVEYTAYESQLMLTASLGQYGAATLTFDNFVLYEEATMAFVSVNNGIANGDFNADGFAVGGEGSSWGSWTTINETWTTPVDATFNVVDGKVVVETLGVGDYVWSIQFQYRPELGLLNVVPGDKYKVEFDVNATVAGTFSMELTTTNNAANVAIDVTLVVGDNHVVVEYTAYEAQLMLTASLGQYGAAVLTFDNFNLQHEVVANAYHEFVASDLSIVNGNFSAAGFAVNAVGSSWSSWTTINETWTTPVDANFSVLSGGVMVQTLGTGDYVWSIQLQYRPEIGLNQMVIGNYYRVEFDVDASVAGTFSMEVTTTNNFANNAFPVYLNVGMNHVSIHFMAMQKDLMLTASLGQYGAATLVFDNFEIFEQSQYHFVPVANGIVNGDFSAAGFAVNAVGSSWSSWTTVNETWTTPVGANISILGGGVKVETLGVGDYVWSIQLQYRPALGVANVIPGDLYRVEFDVDASVGGTFSMEMTTTNNAANVAIEVTLVAGMNHVVVEYVAFEPQFMLTASLGQYGAATLVFDNFKLYHSVISNGPVIE